MELHIKSDINDFLFKSFEKVASFNFFLFLFFVNAEKVVFWILLKLEVFEKIEIELNFVFHNYNKSKSTMEMSKRNAIK